MSTREPSAGSLSIYRSHATDLIIGVSVAHSDDEVPIMLTLWLNGDGELFLGRINVDNFKWFNTKIATSELIELGEER